MFSKQARDDRTSTRTPAAAGPNGKPERAAPSIIAAHLKIGGDLATDGDIEVAGAVEGDVRCARLTIRESGRVTGTIQADAVEISGAVAGEVRAKSVTLTSTARVKGELLHESLAIAPGAVLDAACRRLTAPASQQAADPQAADRPSADRVSGEAVIAMGAAIAKPLVADARPTVGLRRMAG